jgi:hypothetical protein
MFLNLHRYTTGADCPTRSWIFVACALLCALWLTGCDDSSNTTSEAYYFPIVVSESELIANPAGSTGSEDRGQKYGSAWARRTVSTKENHNELRSFYEGQLQKNGWKRSSLLSSRSTSGFDEIDYYCKNNLEAELAFERSVPDSLTSTSLKMSIYWSSGNDKACF